MEAQLKELETRLAQASTQRPQWQERLAILTSVKGIVPVISQALLVHLPELGQRTAKQIAALVGVAPFNRDSGKFRGQRHIHGGRKELRSLLYMAAMCAVQHNSVFRDHYASRTEILVREGGLCNTSHDLRKVRSWGFPFLVAHKREEASRSMRRK